jgi:hypothetical protein
MTAWALESIPAMTPEKCIGEKLVAAGFSLRPHRLDAGATEKSQYIRPLRPILYPWCQIVMRTFSAAIPSHSVFFGPLDRFDVFF